MIAVILMESSIPGNIGAVARAMKNFDFKRLVLIEPKCDHLAKEALDRATHAAGILKKALVKDRAYLKKLDYLIGTTAKLGSDYNIPRSPLLPEQLALKLKGVKANIGILFGRDDSGLRNEEIKQCDFIVTIPVSKKYPTMNLSHAAAIVFYELFKVLGKGKVHEHIKAAGRKEKDILYRQILQILRKMDFSTEEKRETQRVIWKRILGKSFLTKRESFALFGFFRKVR